MTRVKRGVSANKRRKKILKMAKGFRWRRKSNYVAAKEALLKAGKYAHRDRRVKKRDRRGLWITRINNASRLHGLTYRELINNLKKKNMILDRKVMAQISLENPALFEALVKEVKK